ncbi:hypothetical protein CHS0354_037087 [Potamilus streckersoni]|uniref:protein-tyrosine-phosphatase n=1 Tax=Potamilus streckersoni TaxID=2493646 RepID=A0AAE0VGH3_9BIVA|nr:hypothetical protein CHS0354_037087 [Potamilus streckersoni]
MMNQLLFHFVAYVICHRGLGTVNFALNKSTVQSTTLYYNNFYWTADKAVDGNTDGSNAENSRTCSATNSTEPPNHTWEVDIGFQIIIKTIMVYGRSDVLDQLYGFKLYIGNVSRPWIYNQELPLYSTDMIQYVCKPKDAIASVIALMRSTQILTICEVTVEGECLDGMFSEFCNKTCGKCFAGQPCNKNNGTCHLGCDQGWKGTFCKEGCERGNYGYNCNETCGNCLYGNISCSTSDGNCTNGCIAGWQGYHCNKECETGKYGYNCNETCGNCFYGNNSCSISDGRCNNGCKAGWQGDDCKKECATGKYGYNCNETCGNCLNGNTSCSTLDGRCNNGCEAGWQGDDCKQECRRGSYGYRCNETCGNCYKGNISCSMTDGRCKEGCEAGWRGDICKLKCEAGTYGFNCSERCGNCLNGNDNCSAMNGHCNGACQAGWKGETCKSASTDTLQTDFQISVIGGSVGGAVTVVVFILVIVIIIILMKRRRKRPPSNIQGPMDDGILYENSISVDLNNVMVSVNDMENTTKGHVKPSLPNEAKVAAKLNKEDTETYYNVLSELPRGTVPLSKFWDYVQEKCLDEEHFSEEFEKLPSGPQLPMTVALRSENRQKNRYKDLYAYDKNRVVLKPLGNDENDYINASFVDGYLSQRTYIASQGTTKHNLNDFWRMLWQYDVEKVVMLTGLVECGRHKCELYWPEEEGQTRTFGSVSVTLLDTDVFADYEIRTLEMSVGDKSKRLTHFYYTAWPDKGVPRATSSVVLFWNRVNKMPTKKPIVVHCSAGIGRTGTFIALEILVNQGRAEGHVNVSACVSNIRRQRVSMVQTKEQYIFLHETLVEALMLTGTATETDKFPNVYQELLEVDSQSGKRKLQLEYERLQNEDVNHETVYAAITTENERDEGNSKQDEFSDAKKPENKTKNRYDNILPADRHRVILNLPVPGRNDYINAVVLPSHRRRNGFVLTQMPLTGTVIDFWRMIHDLEVRTIVMLNSETSRAHDIGVYWPKDDAIRYGPFSVRLAKIEQERNYIQRTLSFSVIGVEQEQFVTQFQVTNWPENVDAPESTTAFLEILDIIGSWQKEEKPIIVHCLNGAERSGLYCVISTVIERLKLEKDVAVVQTIKRMRAFRQQIMPNYEQFRFCHECILEYMKTFETYTNC